MTGKPQAAWTALAAMLTLLAGCSGSEPVSTDLVSAEARSLFRERCALCHGTDGRGTPMSEGAADFQDPRWRRSASPEDLTRVIAEGRGQMRGFTGVLSPDEIAALAAGLTNAAGLFDDP